MVLDKKKLLAIKLLFDGKLTDQQIANEIGRSRATLSKWKKEPEFKSALDKRSAVALSGLTSKAIHQLSNLLEDAHSEMAKLKAIELVLKASGLLDKNRQALIKAKTKQAQMSAKLAANQSQQIESDQAQMREAMKGLTTEELKKLAYSLPLADN